MVPRKPLGQLLKEQGYVTDEHIAFALKEQKATGERLGETLTRLGIITDFEVARALAAQVAYPVLDPRVVVPDSKTLMKIPARLAKERVVLPFKVEDGVVHVAIADPFDQSLLDSITSFIGTRRKVWIAPETELKKVIEWRYYFLEQPIESEIERVQQLLVQNPAANISMDDLINHIFILAVTERATDIHLSPTEKTSRVFFRIDGLLDLAFVFPASLHTRLVSALKVRAGMDIAEQRLPQDGRMHFTFLGESFDLRVSTVRSPQGENMVIRILPVQATVLHISSLGFSHQECSAIERLFRKPYGIILVTGPTGSGKTTTLHSTIRLLDVIHLNVLSAEDPVEYRFPLIRQTQVAEDIGYDFATAIRHFLRQDPDVILIGEIRDERTAEMAVRAALTGHLVLSTLHANDALSAIPRLRDVGVSAELLASTLLGMTAQRLVRKVCPHCREVYTPDHALLAAYDLPLDHQYLRGKGCPQCRGKGYLGRTAVMEIITVSPEMRRLIAQGVSITAMREVLDREGFTSLRENIREKILAGEVTVEEAERVLG